MAKQIKSIIIASIIFSILSSFAIASVGKAKITSTSITTEQKPLSYSFSLSKSIENNVPTAIKAQSFSPSLTPSKKSAFGDSLFTSSLISLTALNVADFFSTKKALTLPGLAEGNPLLKPIVNNTALFIGVKVGITVLDILVLKKVYKKNKALGWALSLVANFAMSYVVANNFKLIQQAQTI